MTDALGIAQPQRVSFAQMLSGRYFVIPEYQRHYAWTTKQCTELFDDCVLTARNPERERFMSTITTVSPAGTSIYQSYTDQGYAQLKPLLVVDGQQRLTSILIFISCICRRLNNDLARNAFANFVRSPLADQGVLLRVIPQSIPSDRELMREFFEDLVALDRTPNVSNHPIVIPAQRRLLAARATFDAGISDLANLPENERVSLENLLTCLTSRLIFVLNTLSDVGQAGEVFEGLNNRGLSLSALENLKAFAIYAVQSFRRGEQLPGAMEGTASDLNNKFNDAIGNIYHRLDRVGLPDDVAKDLLSAFWPIVFDPIEKAALTKGGDRPPLDLDRSKPVDDIRSSLHIQRASTDESRSALLETLRFAICDKLDAASGFFADARRPMHKNSFETIHLPPDEMDELRRLHQRLVEMQCSAPFLPVMIAHRVIRPTESQEYLQLTRLIERVAFWVYELGHRKKGTGQKHLAQLARNFCKGDIEFAGLLIGLRNFAISVGGSADQDGSDDDSDSLDERIKEVIDSQTQRVSGALAYEWLLSKRVKLPHYGLFIRCVEEDNYLRLVPGGRGRLPHGFDLNRQEMDHPGNIAITCKMPRWTHAQVREQNRLSYQERRVLLEQYGFNIELPQQGLTSNWATTQRTGIMQHAVNRWAIPANGRITAPTWSGNITEEFDDFFDGDQDD